MEKASEITAEVAAETAIIGLHWAQRGKKIQYHIDITYNKIATDRGSNWGMYNGADRYSGSGFDTTTLIEQLLVKQM